jgi:hypothetical protein
MNMSEFLRFMRAPIRAWHRFHIWRAKRIYLRVAAMPAKAKRLTAKADALMRRHAEDPQRRLDLGDD